MWDELDAILDEAEPRVAPAASALVWQGRVRYARRPERIFDLASLTKVLCTTSVTMDLAAAGALDLDAPQPDLWPGQTLARLLQHSAGCLWWKDLWRLGDRAAILEAARREPLPHRPGVDHVYSDLGFLTLGGWIEARFGRIDELWVGPLRWGDPRAEPTEGGLRGVVHDENARAMGGVAPHAGLFGGVEDVLEVCLDVLARPWAARAFTGAGAGSHVLGWDRPSGELSSAGPRPPPDAVGHTGFTGSSVWMSPGAGIVAVLLTNRVAWGRDPAAIRALRHRWHQAVWEGLGAAEVG